MVKLFVFVLCDLLEPALADDKAVSAILQVDIHSGATCTESNGVVIT